MTSTAIAVKMERQNVREAARDILNSKVSKMLLEGNQLPNRSLDIQLQKIDTDMKKQQALLKNEEQLFKRRRLVYSYNPTLVVRRSLPSQLHTVDSGEMNWSPGARQTIDAFKAVVSRKKNVWETRFTERNLNTKFCSMVVNSLPLSQQERNDLEQGWSVYRPVSRTDQLIQLSLRDKRVTRKALARSTQSKKTSNTFITQAAVDEEVIAEREDPEEALLNGEHRLEGRKALGTLVPVDFYSNNAKLGKFNQVRDKQKQKYFQFLKNFDK